MIGIVEMLSVTESGEYSTGGSVLESSEVEQL